jgi:enoyl-CoA hydratase/carnithine racemase
VLDGSGKHFCAGADLPQFTKCMESDPHGTADLGRRAAEALAAIPQITIAAIKGYCIGGALVLSAACDMRIAADNSRFSIPELDAGIPLSWGGMAQVVRLLGETMANDLVLTCRPFDADDALRAGFISRIVAADGFDEAVMALAETVAAKPRIALRQTKRKLTDIRAGTFDARNDANEMIAAMADPEAKSIGQKYIRKNIGK